MRIPLKIRLIGAFLPVVLITGAVATVVGLHVISMNVLREVQEKVRTDLNTARAIYLHQLRDIEMTLTLTSARACAVRDALVKKDRKALLSAMESARVEAGLDILTITDRDGGVVLRARNPSVYGDRQADDALVSRVLKEKEAVSSTQLIALSELQIEAGGLFGSTRLALVDSSTMTRRSRGREPAGMMLKAAVPVFDQEKRFIGVLYGGLLINGNHEIVDRVKDTVYQGITYNGKDAGTVTIYQKNVRVSTNLRNSDGSRAVGTRVSEPVYEVVLKGGKTWIDRAFVVNNWYMSAYEPIRNAGDAIIGMLYVGMLEQKYVDLRNRTIWRFLGITMMGMLLAVLVSYVLASRILKPIRSLVSASKDLAEGDLSTRVAFTSDDEIGELGKTFNFMASSLQQRDGELKERAQRKIMESERLATIGQLAAGVAHEINNPLGGILVFSHLLLEDTPEDDPRRVRIEKIVHEATRCKEIIRGLLEFARQTEPKKEQTDVHGILKTTLALLENHPLFLNIEIKTMFAEPPMDLMADRNQLQQVFVNIMINAAEAMEGNGSLTIKTSLSEDQRFVVIEFTDTGCGIREEDIERLFEPFFTTKEVGHGTGLGLAVSFGIIDRHEGTIEVRSEVGEGTTFKIRLPRIAPSPESHE